jgi:small subunit ribosomal protein S6
VKKYETLFLMPGDVTEKVVQDITQKVTRLIRNQQGHVVKIDDWGKRKLAYSVQKHSRGHYIYVLFLAPSDAIVGLERMMRIESQIAKYHIVKLSDHLTQAQIDQELKGAATTTQHILDRQVDMNDDRRGGFSNAETRLPAVASETGM